ncbi:MAG TPA: hypothetical protein VE359_18850 [Vicinamibacteria bacterium]|nr:hypothetical protein [Vicinamibacteria bacterium]
MVADMGKIKVTVFVSYARANKDLAPRFFKHFKQQTDASKAYRYVFSPASWVAGRRR